MSLGFTLAASFIAFFTVFDWRWQAANGDVALQRVDNEYRYCVVAMGTSCSGIIVDTLYNNSKNLSYGLLILSAALLVIPAISHTIVSKVEKAALSAQKPAPTNL